MRMLAMNSLMHEAERRHHEPSDSDPDSDVDNKRELDPVDGFPSPPMRLRTRRRFVKPGPTTYALSFSRRADVRQEPTNDEPPAVSSLSSVLTEVMTGKNKALDNIVDTTPPQPNVSYIVEHAADGTPFVAASDGCKYFENSTIGQLFIGKQRSKEDQKGFYTTKKKDDKEEGFFTPVLGSAVDDQQHTDNELPMLDPDKVDRSRTDSSWEVLEVKVEQSGNVQEKSDVGDRTSDKVSGGSSLSSVNSGSSSGAGATAKTLPRLQPKKDLPAPPLACDAYDEDDNPLCRSFQNVRDVDFTRSTSEEEEEEEEHGQENEHEDDVPDVDSPDFAGRVRVSSGATSVAEFVGGYRGYRRSGTSGLVNRKRAVRHARLTAAEQKAADLARKIRDARNRIPLEFRDEYMSLAAQNELQKKKKWRALGRHVRFNMEVQCREFEVESEEEDDDGYDSPDEIVDAVQLVSRRDVVRAEDVVAAFPMEQLELPPEELVQPIVRRFEAPSPPAPGVGDEAKEDDPLAFSQLNNDKRMSFSDL